MATFKKLSKNLVISFVFLSLLTLSCKKDDGEVKEEVIIPAPVILSTKIFSLASNAATIQCELQNDSNLAISEAIVYWSTSPDPKATDHSVAGGVKSNFVYGRITGLKPNTTYYAKIYTSNSSGTALSDELSFTTNNTVSDIMGNKYNTVTIGTQVWMVENLMTTKFNDGTSILAMPEDASFAATIPFYCWYENLEVNKYRFGALYNSRAVASGKLCPVGWHIPSDAEWTKLTNFVGGNNAGDFLKEAGPTWNDANANNYSGFSAVPGGSGTVGSIFVGGGFIGTWWSSTIDINHLYLYRRLVYDSNLIDRSGFTRGPEVNGLSVRCIKD